VTARWDWHPRPDGPGKTVWAEYTLATVQDMERTAREFDQNASKILAAAERGERITVTRNGRPVAILSPVTTC